MAIGISPSKLDFSLNRGEEASQKIFIHNLETTPTKVAMTLKDGKYKNQISISPQELILPAGLAQEVEVKATSAKDVKTEMELISLTTSNGELQVLSGVRIPIEVKVDGGWNWMMIALPFLLALLVTSASFYLDHKKLKPA